MIVKASDARENLFKLMETVIATNQPVTITGKCGNVVLLTEADYRSMKEAIYLCEIPGMLERLVKGCNTPSSQCLTDEGEW